MLFQCYATTARYPEESKDSFEVLEDWAKRKFFILSLLKASFDHLYRVLYIVIDGLGGC